MMQLYGHVPSMVHYGVGHVRELHGLSGKVASANAEEDLGVNEDLRGRQKKSVCQVKYIIIAIERKRTVGLSNCLSEARLVSSSV